MRHSLFASLLFAAVAATGCSKDPQPDTLPATALGPEFSEQDKATPPVPAAPASDSDKPIAPDDQIHFAFDSDNLGERERAMLDEVAAWVKTHPDREVVVQGHADHIGPKEHNLDLSARRAQAVGSYLQEKGVAPEKIIVAAQGEEKAGLVPAAANRRVIIFATAIEAG